MEPVKFVALDRDDLEVVSTHLQDALVKVADVAWRPQEKRLVIGLDRFDWLSAEGERPVEDLFVKQVCERRYDGRLARVEARHYYKRGQYAVDPNDNRVTENLFESSARLEVYRLPTEAR